MKNNSKTEELINTLFDNDWYDNVLKAIDLALRHNHKQYSEDDIIYSIIDYNVNKHLEEKALNDFYTELPKVLKFEKNGLIDTIMHFRDIVTGCDMYTGFKKCTIKLIFNDINDFENEFLTWPNILNKEYKNISIKLSKTTKDHEYKLVIKKNS